MVGQHITVMAERILNRWGCNRAPGALTCRGSECICKNDYFMYCLLKIEGMEVWVKDLLQPPTAPTFLSHNFRSAISMHRQALPG